MSGWAAGCCPEVKRGEGQQAAASMPATSGKSVMGDVMSGKGTLTTMQP